MSTVALPMPVPAPLGQLKLADYNPRSIAPEEMAKLKKSLLEFGLVQPLVARRADGTMVGGHQRLCALRELLAEAGRAPHEIDHHEVPVIWVDFDDAKIKALNLALNKISGEWDYEKLAALTTELSATELDLTGFTAPEVADIQELYSAAHAAAQTLATDTDGEPALDVDAAVAARARRLAVEMATDEDVALVTRVLAMYGGTGRDPGQLGAALARVCAVAEANTPAAAEPPPAAPKAAKRAQRKARKK